MVSELTERTGSNYGFLLKNTGSTILRALRAYDSQIFRIMQRKLMNIEVFGTPISVILAVHIPISSIPFLIREKEEF
jgi:hypothetical protein